MGECRGRKKVGKRAVRTDVGGEAEKGEKAWKRKGFVEVCIIESIDGADGVDLRRRGSRGLTEGRTEERDDSRTLRARNAFI